MIKKILIFTLFMGLTAGLSAKDYQASLFGVKSDGITLNTHSIQKAIDFISAQGGGKLVFWVGRYLTGSVELKSNVTIELKEGAALVAVDSPFDYKVVGNTTAMFYANKQSNIRVFGKGLLVGRRNLVYASIDAQYQKGHIKGNLSDNIPSLISFNDCDNVSVDGIMLEDPAKVAMSFKGSKNVTLNNVTVVSSTEQALYLSGCNSLKATNCFLNTKAPALESDGTSGDLMFSHCIMADGKVVSADK